MKPRKRNGNSVRKNGKKNNSPNITETDEHGKKRNTKKSICNLFNSDFSEMGIYRGQIVPLNVGKIERKFQEFNLRPFTLREIYKVIDSLDDNRTTGPGSINAWALKSGKCAIGHIFRIYLTIVFKRMFFQQFLRMNTSCQFSKKRCFCFN